MSERSAMQRLIKKVNNWFSLNEGQPTYVPSVDCKEFVHLARAAKEEMEGEKVIETWIRGDRVIIRRNGEEEEVSLTGLHALLGAERIGMGRQFAIRRLPDPPKPKRVRPWLNANMNRILCPNCWKRIKIIGQHPLCPSCGVPFGVPLPLPEPVYEEEE